MTSRTDTSISVSKNAQDLAGHIAKVKAIGIRTFIDSLILTAFDGLDEKQRLLIVQARERERELLAAVSADLERQELSAGYHDSELEELLGDLDMSEINLDVDLEEIDIVISH